MQTVTRSNGQDSEAGRKNTPGRGKKHGEYAPVQGSCLGECGADSAQVRPAKYLEWPVCECPHCDGLVDVSSAGLKEVKIYRDENARLILEGRQKDQQLKEGDEERKRLREENEQQKLLLLAQDERIRQLEGAAQCGNDQKCEQPKYHPYYDNLNRPMSQNSFTAIQRKKERHKKPEDHKKPGRKKGHKGVSHSRKSARQIRHDPKQCGCGCTDIARGKIAQQRQVAVIPILPKVETVTQTSYDGTCNACGATVPAESLFEDGLGVAVRGTQLGPNLLTFIAQTWGAKASPGDITPILNHTFGPGICKSTTKNALTAVANTLKHEADKIRESLPDYKCLKADETPYQMKTTDAESKRGYIWAAIADNGREDDENEGENDKNKTSSKKKQANAAQKGAVIHAAPSRAAAVLDVLLAAACFLMPFTGDGYAGYNEFKIRQRCWAHILRILESIKRNHPGSIPAS